MKIPFLLCFFLHVFNCTSQDFTRTDSLRGSLTPLRTCYDVVFYDLNVVIDDHEEFIERSYNEIYFLSEDYVSSLQIDIFTNMEILLIQFEGKELNYSREYNAVFIDFPRVILQNEFLSFKIWYSGYPRKAVNPPWDGGFSWEIDKNNNPWIGVSCQGLGASSWWPCKDHQSDEPDSMRITVSCRNPLKAIANGNLRKEYKTWNRYIQDSVNVFEWFVSYPINNYCVSINIGDYIHFSDYYMSNNDSLDLSYYVLSYNESKAKDHFQQVIPMMECFESYFGPYPFLRDGFALIETSYLGMEHQSGIAYGNNYLPGYYGNKRFISDLDFDFIIIHETGHEWWGNSITTNDIADMWIHEGFCTYSEVLYVECLYGYDKMLEYVNNQRRNIRNDKPIVAPYHVNCQGSSDMYNKGSLILHTLRTLIQDDDLWFEILIELNNRFRYQTLDADDIINYIISKTGKNLELFFDQYLNYSYLPEFQYRLIQEGRDVVLLYRWEAIKDFNMPVLVYNGDKDVWIYPASSWKEINLGNIDKFDFHVLDDMFLIDIKRIE